MMRLNALKGNERIGLMKLFFAFLTEALPTESEKKESLILVVVVVVVVVVR